MKPFIYCYQCNNYTHRENDPCGWCSLKKCNVYQFSLKCSDGDDSVIF